jgi:lipopolysaccharide biosynthesis glycosyltransferase
MMYDYFNSGVCVIIMKAVEQMEIPHALPNVSKDSEYSCELERVGGCNL